MNNIFTKTLFTMKNYFASLLLISSLVGFSQIKSGVYKSSSKNGDILLKINEDKTYEMSFFYGEYTVSKDTILFNSNKINSSVFSVKSIPNAAKSSTLKLKFSDSQVAYYSTSIFLGTQETETSEIQYKRLSEFVVMNPTTYEYPKDFSVELAKGKYLYLVDSKNDEASVCKFEVSENTNEVSVEYDAYSYANLKLKGFIDDTTGQLAISDGKTPLLFSFEKFDEPNKVTDEINPVQVTDEKNWKKIHGFIDEVEATYVDSAYPESNKPPYVFKHTIDKNYKDALKTIEKTPTKLLVVAFDLKNKNAKTEFDTFVKTNEESLSSYMYDNYLPEYDKFNYYLATEKDKSILDKYKIKSDKELLFFNSQGDLLYHSAATLTDKQYDYFSPYSAINTELEKVNQYAQLDKALSNKNASAKEITETLKKTLKLEGTYNYATDAVVAPPAPAEMYKVREVPANETEEEAAKVVEEAAQAAAAVDTVEAVYDNYDYSLIKDKENLYSLKATNQQVQEKWSKAVDYFSAKNTYDKDFVTVAKAELNNTGFSNKLFNNQDKLLKNSDFKILDYVYKNYQNIIVQDSITQQNYDYTYYESPIGTVLYDVFYKNTNLYDNPEKKQIDKVMDYYEQYLKASNKDFSVLQNYLNVLKENSDQESINKKYVDYYTSYFDDIIKKDSNIIENLDEAFTKRPTSSYDNWESFKSSFSNLANDVAWHVVEKSTDKATIQKAIIWSETSLKVSKNVHYYLDTLAQLYYKNGEKAKAIAAEEKALELGKDSEYGEEYKITLEKMKNGSY